MESPTGLCWPFESKMRQFLFEEIQFPHLNVELRGGNQKLCLSCVTGFHEGAKDLKKQTYKQTNRSIT